MLFEVNSARQVIINLSVPIIRMIVRKEPAVSGGQWRMALLGNRDNWGESQPVMENQNALDVSTVESIYVGFVGHCK